MQKQAMSLYRDVVRTARAKPGEAGQDALSWARAEFEQHRAIPRTDINRIEHLLRRGRRQLEMLQQADVTGVRVRRRAAGT
jgi:succinate dehydrogenase assembly factor 1